MTDQCAWMEVIIPNDPKRYTTAYADAKKVAHRKRKKGKR